jgi:hypothetical protein
MAAECLKFTRPLEEHKQPAMRFRNAENDRKSPVILESSSRSSCWFDGETSHWHIAVQAFVVGSSFVRSRDIVRIARPFLRRLVDLSGESANFVIEDHYFWYCASRKRNSRPNAQFNHGGLEVGTGHAHRVQR